MTRHDDTIRLRHMLDHSREAVALLKGKTRAELAESRLLQLGLVRLVEIGRGGRRQGLEGGASETSTNSVGRCRRNEESPHSWLRHGGSRHSVGYGDG